MLTITAVLSHLPNRAQTLALRHRELLKFVVVGGTCFGVTVGVNYLLKLTILRPYPVTALAIATLVATIVSYVLNREWSFRTRDGRERRHEAALFFLFSGIAAGLNSLPLYVSRYWLDLRVPEVGLLTQEVADFCSGLVLGTLIGTAFRWWAFSRWVFPAAQEGHPVESSSDSQAQ